MNKKIYVIVDNDGDIQETFPENYNIGEMLQFLNHPMYRDCKLHEATIVIGTVVKDRIHKEL